MKDRTKKNKRKEIFVHFLLLIAYEMYSIQIKQMEYEDWDKEENEKIQREKSRGMK